MADHLRGGEEREQQVARRLRRRRLARSLAPVALALVVGGVVLSSHGAVKEIGYLAIAQGVGLIVAIIPLAFGYNPLERFAAGGRPK